MNRNRTIIIALVLSVSLNLLFVGAIIGRTMFRPHPGPLLGWVLRDLDVETRKKIQPGLEDRAKVIAPLRKEMHEARLEFRRLLNEQELDETALRKSLARLRSASEGFQSTMHHHMVLILRDLEPDQRRKVSRFLMRQHPERRGHKGKPHG